VVPDVFIARKVSMKRFLKALPVIIIGGLALTGCGSVDIDMHVKDAKKADVSVSVEAPKKEIHKFVEKQLSAQQSQQGGSSSKVNAPKGYTAGLILDQSVAQMRPYLGEAAKITSKETNRGKVTKATQTLHDISLKGLASTSQQQQMPLAVTHAKGRYSFNFTPSAEVLKQLDDVTFTVHLPQAVQSASSDGEVSGHSVTWDLKKVKSGATLTAMSEGPGLAWWASALIWIAGIAVTILLIVIALMPSGKPTPGQEPPAAA
jgi:hypothetical protein